MTWINSYLRKDSSSHPYVISARFVQPTNHHITDRHGKTVELMGRFARTCRRPTCQGLLEFWEDLDKQTHQLPLTPTKLISCTEQVTQLYSHLA